MTQYAEPRHVKAARKRLKKPGDLHELRRKLWQAILEAERVMLTTDQDEMVLKAVHALSQAAAHYAKLVEAGDVETRLHTVETMLQAVAKRNGHVPVGVP
jgi:hypothetical protein